MNTNSELTKRPTNSISVISMKTKINSDRRIFATQKFFSLVKIFLTCMLPATLFGGDFLAKSKASAANSPGAPFYCIGQAYPYQQYQGITEYAFNPNCGSVKGYRQDGQPYNGSYVEGIINGKTYCSAQYPYGSTVVRGVFNECPSLGPSDTTNGFIMISQGIPYP
jgi:hypothetical protein